MYIHTSRSRRIRVGVSSMDEFYDAVFDIALGRLAMRMTFVRSTKFVNIARETDETIINRQITIPTIFESCLSKNPCGGVSRNTVAGTTGCFRAILVSISLCNL